jgi:hypothetical protein
LRAHYQVPADKAYRSHDNLDLVAGLGGTAFVPFKCNSQPGESGTLWEKMYLYYSLRREEFMAHYHLRSNAESTFSMVKAKFRDHVRSKTDTAMANEVYCKFLCHNLCVLIQSQCELGIEPVFWQDAAQGEATVVVAVEPVPVAAPAPAAATMPEPSAAVPVRRVLMCGA